MVKTPPARRPEEVPSSPEGHDRLRRLGADGFSDIYSLPRKPAEIRQQRHCFIEEYRLDGIDIDGEYPGPPAEDCKYLVRISRISPVDGRNCGSS